MLEKHIEAYVKKEVEKLGGKCLKWVCPGNAGVPDRIILLPTGEVWFAEFKNDNYQPTEIQRYWIRTLGGLGFKAGVICGMDEARQLVRLLGHAV